jgi:hypothetical protein
MGEFNREEFGSVGDAARELHVCDERVRQLVREGKLAALVTVSGRLFFRLSEVRRLADERSRARHQVDRKATGGSA